MLKALKMLKLKKLIAKYNADLIGKKGHDLPTNLVLKIEFPPLGALSCRGYISQSVYWNWQGNCSNFALSSASERKSLEFRWFMPSRAASNRASWCRER